MSLPEQRRSRLAPRVQQPPVAERRGPTKLLEIPKPRAAVEPAAQELKKLVLELKSEPQTSAELLVECSVPSEAAL